MGNALSHYGRGASARWLMLHKQLYHSLSFTGGNFAVHSRQLEQYVDGAPQQPCQASEMAHTVYTKKAKAVDKLAGKNANAAEHEKEIYRIQRDAVKEFLEGIKDGDVPAYEQST